MKEHMILRICLVIPVISRCRSFAQGEASSSSVHQDVHHRDLFVFEIIKKWNQMQDQSTITYFLSASFNTIPIFFQILNPNSSCAKHLSIHFIISEVKPGFSEPSTENVSRNFKLGQASFFDEYRSIKLLIHRILRNRHGRDHAEIVIWRQVPDTGGRLY